MHQPKIQPQLDTSSISESLFFNSIVLHLAKAINADYMFIAKIDQQTHSSKTIALSSKLKIIENVQYPLEDTPCADVLLGDSCCYAKDVAEKFPFDQMLKDMKINGYIGYPLKTKKGAVIGLMVGLFEQEIVQVDQALTSIKQVSSRVEKEMQFIMNQA